MSDVKKIAYNSIIQIVGKAINVLLGVLAISYLARYLEPSGFGQYTTILTFLQIFGVFLDFGLYIVLLQELSKEDVDKNRIFNNIVTLRIVSGLSFFIIAPAIGLLFPYPAIVKWGIFATSLTFFLNGIIQIYSAVLQKEMKMDRFVISETISKIFFFALIVFFIKIKGGLITILFANNIHSLIFFVMMSFYVSRYFKYKWTFDVSYIKKVIYMSWPIAVTTVLNLVYFKADTLILSIYKSEEAVGFYGAPYKILEVITTLPHMILGLVLPTMVLYFRNELKKQLHDFMQNIFDFFVVICFMIVLVFTVEAGGVINFIAGPQYAKSIPILQILIWPTVIIFFSNLFNYGIIAMEKQRETIKYFLICALLSLVGYFILIPKFSYYGAAFMTFSVELLIAVFSYMLFRKYSGWKINFGLSAKVLVVSIFVYIIMHFIKVDFVIHFILTCLIYVILLILFKIVPMSLIKQILKSKNNA